MPFMWPTGITGHSPLEAAPEPSIQGSMPSSSAQDERNEDNGLNESQSDLVWRLRLGRRLAG